MLILQLYAYITTIDMYVCISLNMISFDLETYTVEHCFVMCK